MIKATGLTRRFKDNVAVDHISFEVGEGEVFGFLGHNGAGKTTTIRMLTGQLRPNDGSASINGHDIVSGRKHIKPLIGVSFEYQNLYERVSGRENMRFFARLHGIGAKRVEELLERVGLQDRAGDKVKDYQLSQGAVSR
jgi:ABC-2 type transport system ATP-binding protein